MVFYEMSVDEKEIYEQKLKEMSEALKQYMFASNNRAIVIDSIIEQEEENKRDRQNMYSLLLAKDNTIKELVNDQELRSKNKDLSLDEEIKIRDAEIEALRRENEILSSFVNGSVAHINKMSNEFITVVKEFNNKQDLNFCSN